METAPQKVQIVEFDISFLMLVWLFIKAIVAIVPALFIGGFFWFVFLELLGQLG